MSRLDEIIGKIEPLDEEAMRLAKERQDNLTKPQGSLGILEELSIKLAGIQRTPKPKIGNKVIFTLAGDHGVVEEGVSAYPQEVTPQMVYNFLRGGAAINVLARHAGARVVVADIGVAADIEAKEGLVKKKVAYGTRNIARGPAMTREQAIAAIEAGVEVFEEELKRGVDIAGLGDMGIGNTTPSSAICAAITKRPVEEVTGRGTGIDDEAWKHKVEVIKRALEVNRPDPGDAVDVLAKLGGYEIAGLTGVALAAAANRVAVVIDGFIATAGALIAGEIAPPARDYMIASHLSQEIGHKAMLEHLSLKPLLNLNLRLGEGTGAALGMYLVEAGVKILNEMATFAEAGVSEKIE